MLQTKNKATNPPASQLYPLVLKPACVRSGMRLHAKLQFFSPARMKLRVDKQKSSNTLFPYLVQRRCPTDTHLRTIDNNPTGLAIL